MSCVCHQSPKLFLEPSCSCAGGHSTPGTCLTWSLLHRVWAGMQAEPWELSSITPLLPGSVEVVIAVLLVTCIVVVVVILGYCFFKNQRKSFYRHRHSHHHHPQPPTPASSTVSTTEDTEHLVYNHTTRPL